LVVSIGVNVAVIVDDPAPTTVAVEPDNETTETVADEYDHEPGTELVTVGGVKPNDTSPKVFDTSVQENNGRIFSTETLSDATMLLYLPVSVGVNEPVIVVEPDEPKSIVAEDSATTAVSAEVYVHEPPTVEPPNETDGGLISWSASPYVAVTFAHVAALGVTRETTKD
jgi:hypothetical protein